MFDAEIGFDPETATDSCAMPINSMGSSTDVKQSRTSRENSPVQFCVVNMILNSVALSR
jgi:hypothetical protein